MSDTENYERINMEARQKLQVLACQMQALLHPGDVANNFLGAGLSVLLGLGEGVTRDWLQTALDALDDDPAKLH